MDRSHQREVLSRLESAHKQTSEAYRNIRPQGFELHPGTEIAQAWPFITAGYCGIEQSFKFLIALEKGVASVKSLLSNPGGVVNDRRKYQTHDLVTLHDDLSCCTQKELADYFSTYQSLHYYVEISSLADFLKAVSIDNRPGKGRGYERWRYSLTDIDEIIPTNSVEFLLAIWGAAVRHIEWKVYQKYRLTTPDTDITKWLESSFEEFAIRASVQKPEGEVSLEDLCIKYGEWVNHHGHVLNAFSRLIHNAHRGLELASCGAPDPLAQILTQWWKHEERRLDAVDADIRLFLTRARGVQGPAEGVRWNEEDRRFEMVPWKLTELTVDELPNDVLEIGDNANGLRRNRVVRFAYQEPFEIQEYRPINLGMHQEKWLCTLQGSKQTESGAELLLRVWESPRKLPNFHVEILGEDCEEIRELRGRIRVEFAAWIINPTCC